jgi:hypothetical protein
LALYEEISRDLALSDPGHVQWQHDFHLAKMDLASLADQSGDKARALLLLQEAEAIVAAAAARVPTDPRTRKALERVRQKLADARSSP